MKTYEYKGFNRDGHAVKGLVEALSVKNAREKLMEDNVLAEQVMLTGKKLRFPPDTRAMVYRELKVLLGAGLPLVKALDILIQSPEMDDSRILLLAGVRDRVMDGISLADALSEASNSVTSFEHAIIETAEQSASLETMLEQLAFFIENQEKLRERVKSALIYPAIVLTVGICVAVLMLGLLVPRAREMLSGSNTSLPFLTDFMIKFGEFTIRWGLLFVIFLLILFFYFRKKIKNDIAFMERLDMKLFKMPLIGKGYTLLVNLRFCQTLSVLLKGGISIIEGLLLAGRATGSVWIIRLTESESESVRHGSSLSDAVQRIPPLAFLLPGLIRIGEAGGELGKLLQEAATGYQNKWERFINRCLSLLEPLLILIIGGFVLLVTLSVLLPVISLSQAVGK